MKQEVPMERWIREVWGWPKPNRKSKDSYGYALLCTSSPRADYASTEPSQILSTQFESERSLATWYSFSFKWDQLERKWSCQYQVIVSIARGLRRRHHGHHKPRSVLLSSSCVVFRNPFSAFSTPCPRISHVPSIFHVTFRRLIRIFPCSNRMCRKIKASLAVYFPHA